MSIINRLLAEKSARSGFIAAISGLRLSGKSTIAGTLPGKTLLIQPAGIEAGNTSPLEKAAELGNELDMIQFSTPEEAFEIFADEGLLAFDNVYIDGISGFTEMVYGSKEFEVRSKRDKWAGFDYIKDQAAKLILLAKEFAERHDKNVFLTYALKAKTDESGNVTSVEFDAKGNATKNLIEGKCPNVLALVEIPNAEGKTVRRLVTKNAGPYTARLGNILDTSNPKSLDADLGVLLKFVKRC